MLPHSSVLEAEVVRLLGLLMKFPIPSSSKLMLSSTATCEGRRATECAVLLPGMWLTLRPAWTNTGQAQLLKMGCRRASHHCRCQCPQGDREPPLAAG